MDRRKYNLTKYSWWIIVNFVLLFGIQVVYRNPQFVEHYYSKGFYHYYSYLPKFLFSWLPFSVGDVFYLLLIVGLLWMIFQLLSSLYKKLWRRFVYQTFRLVAFGSSIYLFFYISWGVNYYRIPLVQQYGIKIDTISQQQHLQVLDELISKANAIRPSIRLDTMDREVAVAELTTYTKQSKLFDAILSKNHLKVKYPLNSSWIAALTVTGYFNPFTHEVQVNKLIPTAGYPFTVVHELSHQMGIGFEDECNFIAYIILKDHPHPAYRYSAYYAAIQYLLRPLYYMDEAVYKQYLNKLSTQIRQDYQNERAFWEEHRSWINQLTDSFYDQYLKHNNQPEGMARYGLMSRLVISDQLNSVNYESK